jgi:ferric-dicitrate binding protein FerR (iron transport regulator)
LAAVLGRELAAPGQVVERVAVRRRQQHHVAAIAAVAAVGSTAQRLRIAQETDTAVAALAGLHTDLELVDEHVVYLADDSETPSGSQ